MFLGAWHIQLAGIKVVKLTEVIFALTLIGNTAAGVASTFAHAPILGHETLAELKAATGAAVRINAVFPMVITRATMTAGCHMGQMLASTTAV